MAMQDKGALFHFMPESHELYVPQDIQTALDEIDRSLHQMLLLTELSASDADLDRKSMQKVLEHLKHKIDQIADQIS